MQTDSYVDGAFAVFKIFSDPEAYALENIRAKPGPTFKWTLGYLFLIATLIYYIESKNVGTAGMVLLLVFWTLAAFSTQFVLRAFGRKSSLPFRETTLLNLTNLLVFLIIMTVVQLFTPDGGETPVVVTLPMIAALIYFFFFISPRMQNALGPANFSALRSFAVMITCLVAWRVAAEGAMYIMGDRVPLARLLHQVP